MSAWEAIAGRGVSDEWIELCSDAMREIQAEALREAAQTIRAWAATQVCNAYDMAEAFKAADLIDPDLDCPSDRECVIAKNWAGETIIHDHH